MALRAVHIDDKYTLDEGVALLTGAQALVRALIEQQRSDRAAGYKTAGYVTGYRGSPLGGVDAAMLGAKAELDAANVTFSPGMNEDLSATAINGSQQLAMFGPAEVEGVFALWYGKAPGVDRAGDAFRHGNVAGSSKRGGVLLAFGDDHGGKSSTTAHQCEAQISGYQMPILYPSSVQEIVAFSLYGWALSRFSGLWVGMKLVAETAETAATIDVSGALPALHIPNDAVFPPGGVNFGEGGHQGATLDPLGDEMRLVRYRLPLVHAFARANKINNVTLESADAPLCVMSAGKAYLDTLHALQMLGITASNNPGVRLFKIGMSWPLEADGVLEALAGCREALVVEEKRPFIEDQVAKILVNRAEHPLLTGKTDAAGAPLLPADGVLDPAMIAIVIGERLLNLGRGGEALRARVELLKGRHAPVLAAATPARKPYFCSGCPHNTSTRTPAGEVTLGGTGCHSMAMWMNRETKAPVQMGGEGANWIGASPFSKRNHVFQNIGDGTFSHSGLLAIRAAVIAKTNITYKLLFNDAVAMTGGQAVEGLLDVPTAAAMVKAAGVARVEVVSELPDELIARGIDPSVKVHPRTEFNEVEKRLSETPGVTVLIFDQVCAAEKRRRRKRGLLNDPDRRVFINEDVCEGCGDCTVKSNCVSILPKDTLLGRKREIDQSNCNKDFSCVNGFCPAFVSVSGAVTRKADWSAMAKALERDIPEPVVAPMGPEGFAALVTGIGGTGVITVGQVLAMAAHLQGFGAGTYNMTGLAQKGGAVMSHLRITPTPADIGAAKVGLGEADLILGCDIVTAGNGEVVSTIDPARTRVILNARAQPTADFQLNRDFTVSTDLLVENIRRALVTPQANGEARLSAIDATDISKTAFGDTLASNLLMVGYAYQQGGLPVSAEAIEQAIKLNGAGAAINRSAFRLGRLAVQDPAAFAALVPGGKTAAPTKTQTLDELIAHREKLLTAYQNPAYAARYRAVVDKVRAAEAKARPGAEDLTRAVATNLAKLMAYKDEYEVARLYADQTFARRLNETFGGDLKLTFHLAPPGLGETKRNFGAWMKLVFPALAAFKGLRGTPFDPFGRTADRRAERQDVALYLKTIDEALTHLGGATHGQAVALLSYPSEIRGYGPVKDAGRARAEAQREKLLTALPSGKLAEVA